MSRVFLWALVLLLPAVMNADRLIRIPAQTDSDFSLVQSLGYEITSGSRTQGFVDIMVSDRYVDETMLRFADARLLPLEWSQPVLDQSRNEFGYYYGPNENNAFWATLAAGNDMVDTPVTYGTSFEGRSMYYVRMTNAGSGAPAIMFDALIHGREPGGNSVVIDFAQWLSTEYGSDTMATFILDNAQIYFVPMVNIDAYYENLPSGGADQRKNMNFTTPVASDGIDLNRNWGYMWGYDDVGSSPSPYSATYRGSAAFSEPETQALRDLIEDLMPIGGFNYHTYGGYFLYPWGYNNQPTPDQALFQGWGAQMAGPIGYAYGRSGQILYNVNGEACDWEYGQHGLYFITPEVDDNGFWGSQNDTTLIVTNNLECRSMNKLLCMNLLAMTGVSAETSTGVEDIAPGLLIGENPVKSVLSYSVTGMENAAVSILDISGRTVAAPDNGTWVVPSGLVNGVYFLRADNGSASVTERFTVVR